MNKRSLTYKLLRGSYAIAFVIGFIYLLIFDRPMLVEMLAAVPVWVWVAATLWSIFVAYVWLAVSPKWVPPISKTEPEKNKRQQK
jgi:hypothetical protein